MAIQGNQILKVENTNPRVSQWLLIGLPSGLFLAALAVVGAFAFAKFGLSGLQLCVMVWVLIVATALAAYGLASLLNHPQFVHSQLMVGMAIRTGMPLIFTLVVSQVAREWIDLGFIYYLFAFYFVGLFVDVFLMLATFPTQLGQTTS